MNGRGYATRMSPGDKVTNSIVLYVVDFIPNSKSNGQCISFRAHVECSPWVSKQEPRARNPVQPT